MPDFAVLADVKTAMGIDETGDDSNITALIPQVTALIETMLERPYFDDTNAQTEFPEVKTGYSQAIFTDLWPINSITSLHESNAVPRVYGADELLVDGTDYLVDDPRGIIYRVGGNWKWGLKTIQLIYKGGTTAANVDKGLVRAAEMIIMAMLQKGKGRLYHATGDRIGDGEIRGVRFDDVPDTARELIMAHKERRF